MRIFHWPRQIISIFFVFSSYCFNFFYKFYFCSFLLICFLTFFLLFFDFAMRLLSSLAFLIQFSLFTLYCYSFFYCFPFCLFFKQSISWLHALYTLQSCFFSIGIRFAVKLIKSCCCCCYYSFFHYFCSSLWVFVSICLRASCMLDFVFKVYFLSFLFFLLLHIFVVFSFLFHQFGVNEAIVL